MPSYLLCGDCGTVGGLQLMTQVQAAQAQVQASPHDPNAIVADGATCECCGSADLTVRTVSVDFVDEETESGLISTRWEPRMAVFPETQVQYDSITALLQEITLPITNESMRDDPSQKVVRAHSVVGVMDDRYTAVQQGTRLLLLDHRRLCHHLFYQLSLRRFACAPKIALGNPVSVESFVLLALELPEAQWAPGDKTKAEIAKNAKELLFENAEMLEEYFSVTFDTKEGTLTTLPALLEGHLPLPEALPMFLLRLASDVCWASEKECFRDIATQIASCYSQLTTRPYEAGASPEGSLSALLIGLLLPAVRALLKAPREIINDDTIVQIAALDQLYKVFERC